MGTSSEWCYRCTETVAILRKLESRGASPAAAGAKEGGDAWWQLQMSSMGNTAAVGGLIETEVGNGEKIH